MGLHLPSQGNLECTQGKLEERRGKGKGSQWEPQEACGVGRAQDKGLSTGRRATGKQEKVWRVSGGKGKLEAGLICPLWAVATAALHVCLFHQVEFLRTALNLPPRQILRVGLYFTLGVSRQVCVTPKMGLPS